MRCIELHYRTGADFLKYWSPRPNEEGPRGGSLFVRTFLPLRVGQEVVLDIEVASIMDRCAVQGEVVEYPALIQVDGRGKRGALVKVNADEQGLLEAFLAALEQNLGDFKTRELQRSGLPMEVESADLSQEGAPLPVADFSAGGVFVVGAEPAPVGQMIQLRLIAPDFALDRIVVGEIAWHGYKDDQEGVGVRFVFKTRAERREWRGIFSRMQRQRQRRLTEAAMASVRSSA